ncbi:MAG: RNA polymerase sigma factor RpoH [Pseudomonadota bacterium]
MSEQSIVPSVDPDGYLARYLAQIRKYPMLDADEEYMLATAWREHGDADAAQKLVTSHLRLVAKTAAGYNGYGLPISDLIAEGTLGLMQAVRRFDPDRGFRLSTYAIWWIKSSIQEYVLRSWSLVRVGTTSAQRKLFFNLRRIKNRLQRIDAGQLTPEHVSEVAQELGVSEKDVKDMDQRMSGGDLSLDVTRPDSDEPWLDNIADEESDFVQDIADKQEHQIWQRRLRQAMTHLDGRERTILNNRRLTTNPQSLETLSQRFGVSRERIRQLEARAFSKIRNALRDSPSDNA